MAQQFEFEASTADGSALIPVQAPFLRFETAVFRLFQGEHGQYAFSSLWWYLDPGTVNPATAAVMGPYSCEQMILAFIAQLLNEDVMVCGTLSTLAAPAPPAHQHFQRLGELVGAMEEGQTYQLLRLDPMPMQAATLQLQLLQQAQAVSQAMALQQPQR